MCIIMLSHVRLMDVLGITGFDFNIRMDKIAGAISQSAIHELDSACNKVLTKEARDELFPTTHQLLQRTMHQIADSHKYAQQVKNFFQIQVDMLHKTLSDLVHDNVSIYKLLTIPFTNDRLHLLIEYEVRMFAETIRAWAYMKAYQYHAFTPNNFVEKACLEYTDELHDPEFASASTFYQQFQVLNYWFMTELSSVAWQLRPNASFHSIWTRFEPVMNHGHTLLQGLVGENNTGWCSDKMARLHIKLVATTYSIVFFGSFVHDLNWTISSHVRKLDMRLNTIASDFCGSPWHGTGLCQDIVQVGLACMDYPVKAKFNAAELKNGIAFGSCYVSNKEKRAVQEAVMAGVHPRLGQNSIIGTLDADILRYILEEHVFTKTIPLTVTPLTINPFEHVCC